MSTTSTPTDSPIIQPMHNPSQAAVVVQPQAPLGNTTNGILHAPGQGTKAMLAKRLASKGGNPQYISPTDNMMTPCTAKIRQSKKKHFTKIREPVQLFMKTGTVSDTLEEDTTAPFKPDTEGVESIKADAMAVDDDENPF